MKRVILCVLIFFTVVKFLCADIPEKKEEVIYSITLFNGLHYSRTFCREESDTIYLLADTDTFLTVRKTLVFFWPLTGKYLVDTRKLNKVFDGTLEIEQDNRILKVLETGLYIIYNDPGIYKNNWKVFIGKEAEDESLRLEGLLKQYEADYNEYLTKYRIYQTAKERLIDRMQVFKKQGKDPTGLLNQYKALIEPVPPLNPAPRELSVGKQFHIRLPGGKYTIRLRNEEGLVLQGSEKQLVLFREQRKGVVGYRIVPGDRWTKPDVSNLPSHILYVNPTTDIYLIPFLQNEYNDFYYSKMLDNDAKGGNPAFYRWEEVKEIPLSQLELTKEGVSISLVQEEFYAEQLKSSTSPGYKIVPYDPEDTHKDREPSFSGFKVPLERRNTIINLKLQDVNGNYYPFSEREIRVYLKSGLSVIFFIIAFLPLLVMVIVLIIRQNMYRLGEAGTGKSGQ
ncbi:MAG: hypothetical protein JXB88_19205 [Spirochaetales bacterium]|nr:hypothetical protein [Spirochaetales bacterium]